MSFFDELPQRVKGVAGVVGEKAREAADSAKISAAILTEKRELSKNYHAIGQWYVCEHAGEAPEAIPEAIRDLVEAVRASQERIAELQASREAAEAAESAEVPAGAVCPVCGKIGTTKFCPHCGAPMGD